MIAGHVRGKGKRDWKHLEIRKKTNNYHGVFKSNLSIISAKKLGAFSLVKSDSIAIVLENTVSISLVYRRNKNYWVTGEALT